MSQKSTESDKFKSKTFDLQEEKKKILAQNKDLKTDLANRMGKSNTGVGIQPPVMSTNA